VLRNLVAQGNYAPWGVGIFLHPFKLELLVLDHIFEFVSLVPLAIASSSLRLNPRLDRERPDLPMRPPRAISEP
jgi:hypothetical protein